MDIKLIVGFVALVGVVAIVKGVLLSAQANVAAEVRRRALGNSVPPRPADHAPGRPSHRR